MNSNTIFIKYKNSIVCPGLLYTVKSLLKITLSTSEKILKINSSINSVVILLLFLLIS